MKRLPVVVALLGALTLAALTQGLADSPLAAGVGRRGDVNCNGFTNAIDSTLILQLEARLLSSLLCESAGDVNHSAGLDAVDSTIILQRVAELIPALPAVVRVRVDPRQLVVGDEFVAQVRVDDVEHLAAFDFTLSYDPALITFVRMEDLGSILISSDRSAVACVPPNEQTSSAACVTLGPPPCFGGASGPSGSGILARAVFRADQPGNLRLNVGDSTLVWDDLRPCDIDSLSQKMPHQREGAELSIGIGAVTQGRQR